MRWILYLFIGLAVIAAIGSQAAPPATTAPVRTPEPAAEEARFQKDAAAVRSLKASMKNPASFKMEQALRMDDGTLCVTYRATNSFNAIVPGRAVVAAGKIVTSDQADVFPTRWNSRCVGKRGSDVTYIRQAIF